MFLAYISLNISMPVLGWQYYHFQQEDPVVGTWTPVSANLVPRVFFLGKGPGNQVVVSAIINLVLRLSLWKWRVKKSGCEIGTDIRVGRVRTALSRRTVDLDSCWELPRKLSRVKMTKHMILCVKMAHKHFHVHFWGPKFVKSPSPKSNVHLLARCHMMFPSMIIHVICWRTNGAKKNAQY